VLALGQKLKIQGTPAIFFADGSRIPGAVDHATLEKKLESIKQ
jgi:thiol:disulfide interchange protein DsbC